MDAVDRAVLVSLLSEFRERLSCDGCSDTSAGRFDLTEAEWRVFKRRVNRWIRRVEPSEAEHHPDGNMPVDWLVVGYLSDLMEEM